MQHNLWKQALEAAYTSTGQTLKHPLGKWNGPPNQLWQNFYDTSSNCIFKSTTVAGNEMDHQFIEHTVTTLTHHHMAATPIPSVALYTLLLTVDWNTVIPAMVTSSRNSSITVMYHVWVVSNRIIPADPKTFKEYVETLPQHVRRLLHSIQFSPGGERVLRECLRNNTIIKIGTDGSLKKAKQTASFGWILIGMKQKLVEGVGPVDRVPEFLSSTRAELFGIAAPNEFLHYFMKYHKIELTSKVIKCVNNRAAISRINKTQQKGSKRR